MVERARVVFLDRDTLPSSVNLRSPRFAHEISFHGRTAPEQVESRIATADIVIVNKTRLTATALSSATRLKLIALAATGHDNVDLDACAARGITVVNIRNYATNTVPEHTFALILALRRSLVPYQASVRAGHWTRANQFCYFDFPIHDLAGSTLGIIGDGALGKAVAALGSAFRMNVLFAAYKGTTGMGPLYTPFDTLLAASDVITLHCPLTPATANLISTREFGCMKRRPLLINTARGGLVDEQALYHALIGGAISGAAFDVASTEPPPTDSYLMKLLDCPNFILTPHVAWASVEAAQGLADQLIESVELFWAGLPRNVVVAEPAEVR